MTLTFSGLINSTCANWDNPATFGARRAPRDSQMTVNVNGSYTISQQSDCCWSGTLINFPAATMEHTCSTGPPYSIGAGWVYSGLHFQADTIRLMARFHNDPSNLDDQCTGTDFTKYANIFDGTIPVGPSGDYNCTLSRTIINEIVHPTRDVGDPREEFMYAHHGQATFTPI